MPKEAWKPTSTDPTRPGLYPWAWVVRPVDTTGGGSFCKQPSGHFGSWHTHVSQKVDHHAHRQT